MEPGPIRCKNANRGFKSAKDLPIIIPRITLLPSTSHRSPINHHVDPLGHLLKSEYATIAVKLSDLRYYIASR